MVSARVKNARAAGGFRAARRVGTPGSTREQVRTSRRASAGRRRRQASGLAPRPERRRTAYRGIAVEGIMSDSLISEPGSGCSSVHAPSRRWHRLFRVETVAGGPLAPNAQRSARSVLARAAAALYPNRYEGTGMKCTRASVLGLLVAGACCGGTANTDGSGVGGSSGASNGAAEAGSVGSDGGGAGAGAGSGIAVNSDGSAGSGANNGTSPGASGDAATSVSREGGSQGNGGGGADAVASGDVAGCGSATLLEASEERRSRVPGRSACRRCSSR